MMDGVYVFVFVFCVCVCVCIASVSGSREDGIKLIGVSWTVSNYAVFVA